MHVLHVSPTVILSGEAFPVIFAVNFWTDEATQCIVLVAVQMPQKIFSVLETL